jgi:hypothetical protein
MNKNKKGQTANAGIMIALVLGVGIAVLLFIFVGALGGQVYQTVEADLDSIANHEVVNESFTPLNNTVVSLANGYIQSGTLIITNSSGASRGLGNYTIDYTAGTIKLITNLTNGTVHLATYTYGVKEIRESIQGSIVSSFSALEKTGSYMPLIVLATIIGAVLFIVLGFASFGNKGSSGNPL